MLCLAGLALSVPVRNTGKAPFQGDYEVADSASGAVNDKNSEFGLLDLPAPPVHETVKEHVLRTQNEVSLIMSQEAVPGAPEAQILDKIPEIDDKLAMHPGDDEPLDADCDSFQTGDAEPYPQAGVVVNMNNLESNATVPEQDAASREVLMDSADYTPVAKEPVTVPAEGPLNVDAVVEGRFDLPPPDREELRRNKCSRNTNGNDVPDPLGDMGEDCGMPEPVIPCETAGNSTKCEPNIILVAPVIPPADKMPPIPAEIPHHSYLTDMSVEFPDFGKSVTLSVPVIQPVMDAVLRAGQEYEIEDWHVLMIRNAGAQIDGERKVFTLEDQKQLVVYLKCAKRAFLNELIVSLPACEDYDVKQLEVRVEVPETDDVFIITAFSNERIENILGKTPIPHKSISKVTYNGARVQFDQSLTEIRFANKSALVVYLTVQASADHVAVTDCNDNLVHSIPVDVAVANPPDANSITTAQSGAPVPPPQNDLERPPMKNPAIVIVKVDGQDHLDFPVLVYPEHFGLALFDAIKIRTGRPFAVMTVKFGRTTIFQETPLKPLGLLNDDVINVLLLSPMSMQTLPAASH